MAQANEKVQIRSFAGMNGGGWTAVVCPVSGARRLTIVNPDLVDAIEVTTDTAAAAAQTVAAGGSLALALSDFAKRGLAAGETVCYVRGAGDQPVLRWEV